MSVTTIDEIVRKLRVKDVRRTICGIATEFGVRARNGVFWKADQFKDFLDCATTLPLRVDHGPIIDSRGCIMNVGVVRYFEEIKYPTHGILALAEVDHAEGYGDQLLSDIAAITSQVWLDRCWGLSLAAHYTDEIAVPYECSVTRSPAFPRLSGARCGRKRNRVVDAADRNDSWHWCFATPRRSASGWSAR
jgi:hypothetical protein